MITLERILFYIRHPKDILLKLDNLRIIRISDKNYLKIKYKSKMGKKLDIENPKTFNEKLQWLKLYDRKDIYTTMVDKYEAKKYVANIIGEEYIIPTLGIYEKWEEIDFDKLPNQFVMKCTHDSGGIVICKDKNNLDIKKAKKKIYKSLKYNYFYFGREWPYKNVKPRIIIEKYMEDESKKELKDYKFFCFNGKVKICLVCTDRQTDLKETFFDDNWNIIEVKRPNHKINANIKKPVNFELMKVLAGKLSKNIPFIRVDFYEYKRKIYFGELTFFPASGFVDFEPRNWDYKLGEFLNLSLVKNEK